MQCLKKTNVETARLFLNHIATDPNIESCYEDNVLTDAVTGGKVKIVLDHPGINPDFVYKDDMLADVVSDGEVDHVRQIESYRAPSSDMFLCLIALFVGDRSGSSWQFAE
ncbi:hypothetical protein V8E54_012130 [Elaphomyces granulatus]